VRSQDIEIPEPCHADWATMRPEEKGRFCFECSKKVHDLSAMTKPEAQDFLRSTGCADICVSYEHHEDGTLVFRDPAPRPAPMVPLARLRRPRSVAAAVAGAGMAVALAACAPHGDASVRYTAETPVFQAPSVVIPHGNQEATPVPVPPPVEVVEDEPCDPVVAEETEPTVPTPDTSRVRGRMPIRRTAGKPVAPRTKGNMVAVDPLAL
jgi:hypothetical protein